MESDSAGGTILSSLPLRIIDGMVIRDAAACGDISEKNIVIMKARNLLFRIRYKEMTKSKHKPNHSFTIDVESVFGHDGLLQKVQRWGEQQAGHGQRRLYGGGVLSRQAGHGGEGRVQHQGHHGGAEHLLVGPEEHHRTGCAHASSPKDKALAATS